MTPEAPRILVILLGLIGDTMMRIPLVRELRKRYPQARITGICDPITAPVLEVNPLFDRVQIYDRKHMNAWRKAGFYLQLRRARFDITVDCYYGSQTPLLARVTGAPMRLGPARDAWARLLLTHPAPFPLPPTHKIDCHLPIVEPLGISSLTRRWEFPLSKDDHVGMRRVLREADIDGEPGEDDILLVIGAGDISKRWPEDHVDELLRRISIGAWGGRGRALIVTDQRDPQIVARWADLPGVQILPSLTLPQLAAAMATVGLTFVPDTGPMHIAVATARRVLTFFLSTDPQLHCADRPAYRYLYRKVCDRQPCDTRDKDTCGLECRGSISVDEIVVAGRELLAGPGFRGSLSDVVDGGG